MNVLEKCTFDDLCRLAFDDNKTVAFNASIELARRVGIPEDQILHTVNDIDKYFTE